MRATALAVLGLLLAGCTGPEAPSGPPAGPDGAGPAGGTNTTSSPGDANATFNGSAVTFEPIRGCHGKVAAAGQAVVRSLGEWGVAWARWCDRDDARPTPDFENGSVVAAFWGEKPTSGFALEVAQILRNETRAVVHVNRTAPGPGCAVTNMTTYPAAIVATSRLPEAVDFVFEDAMRACSSSSVSLPDGSVNFERIAGCASTWPTEGQVLFRDNASWAEAWARFCSNSSPKPPPPAVDFATENVVVVSWGTRPSGGFDIRIRGISTLDGAVTVSVERVQPGAGCGVPTVITYPIDIVRTPRLPDDVWYDVEDKVRAC